MNIKEMQDILFNSIKEAKGETFMIDIGEYDKIIRSAHELEDIFERRLRGFAKSQNNEEVKKDEYKTSNYYNSKKDRIPCDNCGIRLFYEDYSWNGGLCDKCKKDVVEEIDSENMNANSIKEVKEDDK